MLTISDVFILVIHCHLTSIDQIKLVSDKYVKPYQSLTENVSCWQSADNLFFFSYNRIYYYADYLQLLFQSLGRLN